MTAIKIIRPLTPELRQQMAQERSLEAEKAVLTERARKEAALDATLLQADDKRIVEALANWHEAGRAQFDRNHTAAFDYDTFRPKTAVLIPGNRFIQLRAGDAVMYLVDRLSSDHELFTSKSDGTILARAGNLATWTKAWGAQAKY